MTKRQRRRGPCRPVRNCHEKSDAWRITSYGFIHDTEHALLASFEQDTAIEVAFHLDFSAQFDQAGIFIRVDDTIWIRPVSSGATAPKASARW
ncbi:DUF1349 domain-containing protein [Arthrobacter sp. SA17]